jgi:parvulin-like peptidyl-prolyl isomerase
LAQKLLERARAGEDFAPLVQEFTNDQSPGIYSMSNFSAENSAADPAATDEIGPVFPRGAMVRSFGDVSFSLEVGEIGMTEYDSTNSPYGWHIIKRLK